MCPDTEDDRRTKLEGLGQFAFWSLASIKITHFKMTNNSHIGIKTP